MVFKDMEKGKKNGGITVVKIIKGEVLNDLF